MKSHLNLKNNFQIQKLDNLPIPKHVNMNLHILTYLSNQQIKTQFQIQSVENLNTLIIWHIIYMGKKKHRTCIKIY